MKVLFFKGKNSSDVLTRIEGKVSFPNRNGVQPKENEIWDIEILGQNKTGKVNFLKLLNKIGSGHTIPNRALHWLEKNGYPIIEIDRWWVRADGGRWCYAYASSAEGAEAYERFIAQKEKEEATKEADRKERLTALFLAKRDEIHNSPQWQELNQKAQEKAKEQSYIANWGAGELEDKHPTHIEWRFIPALDLEGGHYEARLVGKHYQLKWKGGNQAGIDYDNFEEFNYDARIGMWVDLKGE